jgi:sulfotransferase family protein
MPYEFAHSIPPYPVRFPSAPEKPFLSSMPRPFFLIGALRSGTTVFRLMLRAHEAIDAPGEMDFLFDYLIKVRGSEEWRCDLDALRLDRRFQARELSLPNTSNGAELVRNLVAQLDSKREGLLCICIHRHADVARALFPDSKFIHLVRDPRDVATSCIGMGWAGNTFYGIDSWVDTETNWDAASASLDKKYVLEVRFEELISHIRGQLERVCSFLSLPFSEQMLNYSTQTKYLPPDPSAVQRWRTSSNPRDIALVEIKARHLLLQRQYELSGYPLDPPSLAEKIYLFCTNKAHKWKFGIQYYGPSNFLLAKITSKLAKPFYPIYQQRMNEIEKHKLTSS